MQQHSLVSASQEHILPSTASTVGHALLVSPTISQSFRSCSMHISASGQVLDFRAQAAVRLNNGEQFYSQTQYTAQPMEIDDEASVSTQLSRPEQVD